VAEQRVIPREVKLAGVDMMHYPHWNVPIFSRVPFVVTIHDLILLEQRNSARTTTKGPLVHGFKYAGFRTVLENAIHRSRAILTVTNYSKERILEHFGVKPGKIHVTHNGIMPARNVRTVSLSQLGVYEPYFLYVGNAYPHKNLEMMMHAFRQFVEENPYVQLVIAGRRDVFSRRLEQEATELGLSTEQLRFIDLPTDDEIAMLYKHASLFVFPSRLEGFGMPPLEAMSYGTPVAAAHSSSLPEVLGKAAHYFDPDDIERLVQIMTAAKQHPEAMQRFSERGLEQVKKFSWRVTAEQTLEIYKTLLRS
jgi:glycosyltransferase involved in cell wall biosynthesis